MRSRLKYRKGLKIDPSQWQILRDKYSLLDPSHEVPRSPRFAFSDEPFLVLKDRFGRRGLEAGVQRTDEGLKVWWLAWLRDGEEQMHMCPDSLQDLLFYLENELFQSHRIASRQPEKKRR